MRYDDCTCSATGFPGRLHKRGSAGCIDKPREPEWLRRRRETGLPAKDMTVTA